MKNKIRNSKNSQEELTESLDKKPRVRNRKIRVSKLNVKKTRDLVEKEHAKKGKKSNHKSELTWKEKIFTKKYITYFIVLLIDIIFIYYVAKKNIVNYAVLSGKYILIGDSKKLIFGRNYISIIVTVFFYGYYCLMNHFFLHEKNTKKFLLILFLVLVCVNFLFFFLFTTRVY